MEIQTACPPKKHKRSYKNLFTTQKYGRIKRIYKGFGNYQPVPFIQHYSFTSFRGFTGSSRRLFKGYLWPGDYVCIMCHHSSIFVSHDLLLHSDSKTHRSANHQTGEIHPRFHDRDIAKNLAVFFDFESSLPILKSPIHSIHSIPNLPGTGSTTSLHPLLGHFPLCRQQCHRTSPRGWKRGGGADGTQGPSTHGRTAAGLAPSARGCWSHFENAW